MRRTLDLVAAITIAAAQPALGQQIIGARDSLTNRVDSVFRAFDRTDAPGCAVGIYRDARIVYARGYGMADLERGIAITPRTVMDVGSITKQFTATAIILLAQDGKLRIDDPVRKYVPELPPYADSITLRHLLNHTSGMRDYLTMMGIGDYSFEGSADTVTFLKFMRQSARTNYPIQTKYLYSNTGFALLGQIVYRVSGMSLAQFVRQRVFEPLGMRDSRLLEDHATIIPNRAIGYSPRGNGWRLQTSQFDGTGGAGSTHTTVEDFALWFRNFDSLKVGGAAWRDALLTRGKLRNDSTISYALGIVVDSYRGIPRVWHNGSWAGYRATYARFPDQHLGVTSFCNNSNQPDSLVMKVASIYLGAQLQPDTVQQWIVALAGAPTSAESAANLRNMAGMWRNVDNGTVQRITMRGDSLFVGYGATPTRLMPLGNSRFRTRVGNTEYWFNGGGTPPTLSVRAGGAPIVYTRMMPVTLTPAQLGEYAAEYTNAEVETTWAFAADSGRLVLRVHDRRSGGAWEPAYKDAFAIGGSLIDFTRDGRGRINGFVLQSGRVRELRFVKK